MGAPTGLVGAFLALKSPVDNPFSIKITFKKEINATKLKKLIKWKKSFRYTQLFDLWWKNILVSRSTEANYTVCPRIIMDTDPG